MLTAQELACVVTLECVGEVTQEVDQDGGGVVREFERQDHDGQIVGFHERYCFGFFGERCGLRRAARS